MEVGIIAAKIDFLIPPASTHLAGEQDYMVLGGSHGMLPWRAITARQVLAFLRTGEFRQF